jgi:hypothetical protein
MKAERPGGSTPEGEPEPEAPPRRTYARRIDCAGKAGAPPAPEVENGRGTGRLRAPRDGHD